jgi:hypothetical protein
MPINKQTKCGQHLQYIFYGMGLATIGYLANIYIIFDKLKRSNQIPISNVPGDNPLEWEGRGTIADGNGDFVVACDSSPCKGFFAYSPPNDSASASELFKYAYDRYRHAGVKVPDGEQKDIFMPMVEGGLECIKKWKDGQKEGKKRQVSSVSIVSQNIKTSPYSL